MGPPPSHTLPPLTACAARFKLSASSAPPPQEGPQDNWSDTGPLDTDSRGMVPDSSLAYKEGLGSGSL